MICSRCYKATEKVCWIMYRLAKVNLVPSDIPDMFKPDMSTAEPASGSFCRECMAVLSAWTSYGPALLWRDDVGELQCWTAGGMES